MYCSRDSTLPPLEILIVARPRPEACAADRSTQPKPCLKPHHPAKICLDLCRLTTHKPQHMHAIKLPCSV